MQQIQSSQNQIQLATKEQVLIILRHQLVEISSRFLAFCNSDSKKDRIQYISDIRNIATDVRNYVRKLLCEVPGTLPPKMALNHDEAKPDFDLFALNLDQAYKRLFWTSCEEKEILAKLFNHDITDNDADKQLRAAHMRWLSYIEIMGRIASDLAIYALHLPLDYIEPYALEQAKIMTGE